MGYSKSQRVMWRILLCTLFFISFCHSAPSNNSLESFELLELNDEIYTRECGHEGLKRKTLIFGQKADKYFEQAITHIKIVIAQIQQGMASGGLLAPQIPFTQLKEYENFFAGWSDELVMQPSFAKAMISGWYIGFNDTLQKHVAEPAIRLLSDFCKRYHSAACTKDIRRVQLELKSIANDTSCPLFCKPNGIALYNDSLYNLHASLTEYNKHYQTFILSHGVFSNSWYTSRSGLGTGVPFSEQRLLDIFSDTSFIDWDQPYYYMVDDFHNPNRELIWSPPYQDPYGAGNLISLVSPLYLYNVFHGAWGCDIKLGNSLEFLRGAKITPHSFYIVVDKLGTIIGGSPGSVKFLLGKDAESSSLSNTLSLSQAGDFGPLTDDFMKANGTQIGKIMLYDVEFAVGYHPIGSLGWIFAIFAPVEETYSPASLSIDRPAIALTTTMGVSSNINITLTNTGELDLSCQIQVDSLNEQNVSDWVINTNFGVDQVLVQSNQSVVLSLVVNSPNTMKRSAAVQITCVDTLNGFCFRTVQVVKIDLNVKVPIDTYVYVEWESARAIFFTICASIAIIICLLFLIGFELYQDQLKASSILFCQLITTGSILVFISFFFWNGRPSEVKCNLRVWFFGLGYSLILGASTAKNFRVWKILNSDMFDINLRTMSNAYLLLFLCFSLTPKVIFMSVWSGVSPLKDTIFYDKSYLSPNEAEIECYCDHFPIWIGVFFALEGPSIIFGCWLTVATRKINEKMNESRMLALMMYNILIVGLLILLLIGLVEFRPESRYIICSLGIIFVALANSLFIFVPKFSPVLFSKSSDLEQQISLPHLPSQFPISST